MKIVWKIEKIKCQGCVESIAQALLLIDGLSDVVVDPKDKIVTFEASDQSSAEIARKALQQAGYPPK